jgi:hypothetical protein
MRRSHPAVWRTGWLLAAAAPVVVAQQIGWSRVAHALAVVANPVGRAAWLVVKVSWPVLLAVVISLLVGVRSRRSLLGIATAVSRGIAARRRLAVAIAVVGVAGLLVVLAKTAIPESVLWPLLLGSGLTLLAQWLSLAYQTTRQRQARRADRQEARLLALQDLLGEVDEAVRRAMDARRALAHDFEQSGRDPDEWKVALSTSHPDMETLRSLTYRLRLLAAGVEHERLRIVINHVSRWAWLAPLAPSDQEAEDARDKLIRAQNEGVDLLGERLRQLP